mmetsp:Transcript_110926/g.196523  ORF Transcript_110926/g.196523 Transcript_110926/m.196523 type:complete len:146 (-) Transcript_110926:65-502(-)
MHKIALVLACLASVACVAHGRRVQTSAEQMLKAEQMQQMKTSEATKAEEAAPSSKVEDAVPSSEVPVETTKSTQPESSVSISGKGSKLANLLMACKTDGAGMNSAIDYPSISKAARGSPQQRLSGLQKLQAEAYMIRRQFGIDEL